MYMRTPLYVFRATSGQNSIDMLAALVDEALSKQTDFLEAEELRYRHDRTQFLIAEYEREGLPWYKRIFRKAEQEPREDDYTRHIRSAIRQLSEIAFTISMFPDEINMSESDMSQIMKWAGK